MWSDLKFLASRPKYLFVQALNLSGSVAFAFGMGNADLSVGPAVANGVSMVLTCVISSLVLHEEPMSGRTASGVGLIFTGMLLCVSS